jgi:Putative adhesin
MSVRSERSAAGSTPPVIDVRDPAGSVTIEAVEGAEDLEVRVEALDPAADDLLHRVQIDLTPPSEGHPARLRVSVPEPRLFRTPSFAVHVTTPAGARARVAVASADAAVRGRMGPLELTSASGDLGADHCTALQLRSASGDARIGTVTGEAVLGSASGELRIDRVQGALKARTASGDVSVGAATGTIGVTTASGEVSIGELGEGRLKVKSVSGDVTVGVVPGLRVWLDLSSVSGRMDSQLDDDGRTPGEGAPQLSISIRSVSGDQSILRAAGASLG